MISQVTYTAKNEKCVSLHDKEYLINTEDKYIALSVGQTLINKEKHGDKYKALSVKLIEMFEV